MLLWPLAACVLRTACWQRAEDSSKEAERERQRKQREKDLSAAAAAVRQETSDEIIDASKRTFYEQRLKSAQETRALSAASSKERTERKAAWNAQQSKRRIKAKTCAARSRGTRAVVSVVCGGGGGKRQQGVCAPRGHAVLTRRPRARRARGAAKTSRDQLLATKSASAVAMRESKKALSEEHKQRMQARETLPSTRARGRWSRVGAEPPPRRHVAAVASSHPRVRPRAGGLPLEGRRRQGRHRQLHL